MKKAYEAPEMEVVIFQTESIMGGIGGDTSYTDPEFDPFNLDFSDLEQFLENPDNGFSD